MAIEGASLVLTNKGLLPASGIRADQAIKCYTHQGWQDVLAVKTEDLGAVRVTTELGNSLCVESTQKFMIRSAKGIKPVSLSHLSRGDKVTLLTGENVSIKYLPSVAVERDDGRLVNGHFTAVLACFVAFCVSRGSFDGSTIKFQLSGRQTGLAILFNQMLRTEGFEKGEISVVTRGEAYTYTIADPKVFQWLTTNGFLDRTSVIPQFLLTSPLEAISGFLVGYLLGTHQTTQSYRVNFPTLEDASLFQRLLFRQSIITRLDDVAVVVEHERARAEFDRVFAAAKICPHLFTIVERTEPFQQFYETKITNLEMVKGLQSLYRFQVDEVGVLSANGYYVAG